MELALVYYSLRLMFRAGVQPAVWMDDNLVRLHTDPGLEGCGYLSSYLVVRFGVIPTLFDFYGVLTGEIFLKNSGQIFSGDARTFPDHRFDIAGEYVDGGNNEHVILTSVNMDPAVGSTAGARRIVNPADVSGAEPDERTGMLAQGGKDKFSYLTGFQNFACVNVNGLHKDMVFSDMQSVLGLTHGGAGSKNI